jgi:UDP:flavonoid glycosyltransferase YjiC (YdhE family)
VLFVAETVSLGQVLRPALLARSLDPARYDIHFAAAHFDPMVFDGAPFRRWNIHSVSPGQVQAAIQAGSRIHEPATLERYVQEELTLIAAARPALIVGDFRPSLAVSAPASGVPLMNVVSAYWSPRAVRGAFPMPDHPIVRRVGEARALRYFPRALPHALSYFAAPVNALRKRHKLAPLGDLLEQMVWGDHVIYPDTPSLVPLSHTTPAARYIGPILWSAPVTAPDWFDQLGRTRPLIYLTMGTSGNPGALPVILQALGTLHVHVMVATADSEPGPEIPSNVRLARFLPGTEACRRASLVICNGGASTAYQALSEGCPVLGIPHNLDQYLAMSGICQAGAGRMLRSGTLQAGQVRLAAQQMLEQQSERSAAARVAADFARWNAAGRFREAIEEVLG